MIRKVLIFFAGMFLIWLTLSLVGAGAFIPFLLAALIAGFGIAALLGL